MWFRYIFQPIPQACDSIHLCWYRKDESLQLFPVFGLTTSHFYVLPWRFVCFQSNSIRLSLYSASTSPRSSLRLIFERRKINVAIVLENTQKHCPCYDQGIFNSLIVCIPSVSCFVVSIANNIAQRDTDYVVFLWILYCYFHFFTYFI